MKDYLTILRDAAHRTGLPLKKAELDVVVGNWLESSVLKVQRKHWVDTTKAAHEGRSEIFFSVWMNEKGRRANRTFYNIHALRLRAMRGYSLQSREFASAFRSRFAPQHKAWPNVSLEFGPQTLFEGWVPLDDNQLDDTIVNLLHQFIPLADVIDAILEERKSV